MTDSHPNTGLRERASLALRQLPLGLPGGGPVDQPPRPLTAGAAQVAVAGFTACTAGGLVFASTLALQTPPNLPTMLAQAVPDAPSTGLWAPIISLIAGIIVGAVVSHLFERRRWRIEARKDAYVRFAMAADHFRTEASKIRSLLEDHVTNYLFGRLHKAFEELRPAYYELRLLAPHRLADIAESVYVSADEFVERIDPQGSGWGVDPPVFADDYIAFYRRFAPLHEDVDAFVERARLDLTVETRAARAARDVRMAYRRLRRRMNKWRGRVTGDE